MLALVWVVASVWALASSWNAVDRVEAMPQWEGRPADTAGRNYLLVGSDQRDDMTAEERNRLGTGGDAGQRTDTIMLVHVPLWGDPTLVSIPRDSYLPIRGVGEDKINASYAIGGAPLLVDTVEQNTGLRVDGYLEIGFSGFSEVVDSVGGVEICLDEPIADEQAHIDLPQGCQELDGPNALGYVRARYFDPSGDLGRVQRQRTFLSALSGALMTPGTVLLPWNLASRGQAVGSALTVAQDDSMFEVASALNAVREASGTEGHQVTVPASNIARETSSGLVLDWDNERAGALWEALREGTDLPEGL